MISSAPAFRQLHRAPGFSLVAITVIALGIGATAAVLSIIRGVLLAPLPYPEAGRLVHLGGRMLKDSSETEWPLSPLDLDDAHELTAVFASVGVISNLRSFNLERDGSTDHVDGELVSWDALATYRVAPALGRLFTADETRAPGAAQVVIVSHDLWRTRFGGDSAALGRALQLNDATYRLIGVMPPGFHGISDGADLWLPMGLAAGLYSQPAYLEKRQFRWAQGIARLRPELTVAEAQTRFDVFSGELARRYPVDNHGLRVQLTPLSELVRGNIRTPLLALLAAAVFLLLIACTNVANLLLARGAARTQELAVRRALGAGTGALVRQLLAEAAVLGGAGGLAGLVVAHWLVLLLLGFGSLDIASYQRVRLDGWVMLATLGTVILATLGFGLLPAVLASRGSAGSALLRAGARSGAGTGKRFQATLIGVEAGIAVVLLAGAGLTARGFHRFMQRDLGYRPDGLLSLRLDFALPRFAQNQTYALTMSELVRQARALPGVANAAMEGPGYPTSGPYLIAFSPADRPYDPQQVPQARRHNVTPGYFATLGIPLLAGRDLDQRDQGTSERVVVLSARLANQLWPGESPLGKQVIPNGNRDLPVTVVGVVGDVQHDGPALEADVFTDAYVSALQFPPRNPALAALLVRGGDDVAELAPSVGAMIREAVPGIAPYAVATLRSHLEQQNAEGRFLTFLMSGFAGAALLLAAVGIYGVVTGAVVQRTREIGIRMALGAGRGQVLGEMLRFGLRPAAAGAAAGVAVALLLARVARSLWYGLSPSDPATFAGVVLLLVLVTLGATLLPARRATRVDPQVALRAE